MKNFFITDSEGNVTRSGAVDDSVWGLLAKPGETLYEGLANYRTDYIKNGVLKSKPLSPAAFLTWDMSSEAWIDARSLDEQKEAQWLFIKSARDSGVAAGFIWDGSKFDSDQVSQARIQGAVSLAGLVPGFSIDWTLYDNTVRTLSAAEMIAVGVALGTHVQFQFDRARELRAAIAVAISAEAVAAVSW